MNSQVIKNKIKKLPDAPGVYKFVKGARVLYVGKATSLRDRVRSYFNKNIVETRGPLISKMLTQFDDIKFQKTDSVLEALILEANLIKKLEPPANTIDKDDKSFNYVVITNEEFPRVLIVRGKELNGGNMYDISYKFGPFPNGSQLKEAIKIVRKLFPFRDKCLPAVALAKEGIPFISPSPSQGEGLGVRLRGCFNHQIGLCPGVCTGEISEKEYAKTIKNIILFFESKKEPLIKKLEKQMKDFAKNREFEKAQKIKRQIFALGHIQDISLIKDQVSKSDFDTKFRIESYDIAHLSGTNMVGVMTVIEDGETKKSDYRKFKIRSNTHADDTKALAEILDRRLNHTEWPLPDLIVVDGGQAQINATQKVLKTKNLAVPVASVVKDERHRPKGILKMETFKDLKIKNLKNQILLANAEAHRFAISFHRKLFRAIP